MDRRVLTHFPWLRSLPDDIRNAIDCTEFFDPDGVLLDDARWLEEKHSVYVMLYNSQAGKEPPEGKRHLCRTIQCAAVSEGAVKDIRSLEKAYADKYLTAVFYQKPVTLQERP